MSVRDRFRICPLISALGRGLKNVGVPSIVVTRGFVRPPFSNSWADIFLTGVPDPELLCDPAPVIDAEELFFRLDSVEISVASSCDDVVIVVIGTA